MCIFITEEQNKSLLRKGEIKMAAIRPNDMIPTKKDIDEKLDILKDFGVFNNGADYAPIKYQCAALLTNCKNMLELDRMTKEIIKDTLCKMEMLKIS